ncbi:cytochrome P450 18a1-like [Anneissia japonica]|uniref:cytochrome P450 18a1-like n=1 Tax=Anneissia japonica TaxID=1529436 RepID=UPI001425AD8D|nr:cytochrome P450 18a1-like [Anneissia japonica]
MLSILSTGSGITIYIFYSAILLLCILLCLILRDNPPSSGKSPPGPNGIPILGNLLVFLGEKPHLQFYRLAREFGSVFRVRIGRFDVIALNDFNAIREAANKHKEIKRYMAPVSVILQKIGTLFKSKESSLDEQFKDVKRVFGSPKDELEVCAAKETEEMVKVIHLKGNEAFELKPMVLTTVINTTLSVFNMNRCKRDDVRLKNTADFSKNIIQVDQYFHLLDVLPVCDIFKLRQFKTLALLGLKLQNFVNEKMQEFYKRDKEFVGKDAQNDEESKEKKPNGSDISDQSKTNSVISLKLNSVQNISCTLRNSLIAGTHTVTNTFNIAMFFIAQNPKIMERVQKEIHDVTGGIRRPTFAEKANMPYTEATILEMLRISRLVVRKYFAPNGGSLSGYKLCPGTLILVNYYAVHHNPDVYPDPEQFKPERFLDAEGKIFKPKEYIPFGTGPRMCKGLGLARVDLFILFTYLLQCFTFSLKEDMKNELEGILGYNEEFIYEVTAVPRQGCFSPDV